MTQAGYQEGSERHWWWKVAQHVDEAQLALANAAAHNTGDPGPVILLQDRMREAQAILLHIFREKGLVPAATNGAAANGANGAASHAADSVPPPSMSSAPPIEMPPPPPLPAGWSPGPGAWVPATEPQEDAASPAQESVVTTATKDESEEKTPIAVHADVVPSATPSADSIPEP